MDAQIPCRIARAPTLSPLVILPRRFKTGCVAAVGLHCAAVRAPSSGVCRGCVAWIGSKDQIYPNIALLAVWPPATAFDVVWPSPWFVGRRGVYTIFGAKMFAVLQGGGGLGGWKNHDVPGVQMHVTPPPKV